MLGRRNLTAWFDGTAVLLAGFATIALLALPRAAQIADPTLAYAAHRALGTVLGSVWLARLDPASTSASALPRPSGPGCR